MTVAALFVRADSVYKGLEDVDSWDAVRDARKWPGGCAVVAHPPCRGWGALRGKAKCRPGEVDLAPWAVARVREWGGVLEHPASSQLWAHCNLPAPGARPDVFGGWTLGIYQGWWGHPADKPTLLYIVGVGPADLPTMPYRMGRAPKVVTNGGDHLHAGDIGFRTECTKREREHTPPDLARWLVDVARRCGVNKGQFDGKSSGGELAGPAGEFARMADTAGGLSARDDPAGAGGIGSRGRGAHH